MNQREKLIEEIRIVMTSDGGSGYWGDLADFILADRRRVVEPLVKWKLMDGDELDRALEKTLKNAGEI